jgi:hypothetical protein
MVEAEEHKRTMYIYLIAIWIAINVLLMLLMLPEDYMDLNNWIELALWIASIAGWLSMKKWGAAFVTFTLCYTLSTSVGILIYYQIWPNAVRVVVNAIIIVYMFRSLFAGRFK